LVSDHGRDRPAQPGGASDVDAIVLLADEIVEAGDNGLPLFSPYLIIHRPSPA
jgi:hypothetical protein